MSSRTRISAALVGLLTLVLVAWLVQHSGGSSAAPRAGSFPAAEARSTSCGPAAPDAPGARASGLPVRALCALPPEASRTWRLIQRGGPFPDRQDGVVFGNREAVLPAEPGGYYHEYTVGTRGSADRGARRLVTGSARELYFSSDHYASFVVVDAGG